MHILQVTQRTSRPRFLGFLRQEPQPDFSWLLDEWLKSVRPKLKTTTFAAYSTIAERHLRPAFGELRISQLTENDVCDFLSALSLGPEGLAPSTVRSIANVLRAVIAHGRGFGCRVEPEVCRCTLKGARTGIHVFSDSEQEQIVSYCGANPSYKNIGILVCLHTGLRLGELCALKWGDISSEEGVISVCRTLSRVRCIDDVASATELYFGEPKSLNSRRKIPLSPQLSRLLEKFRQGEESFVLSGSEKPVEPRSMQRHFKVVLRRAGVADRNFHALRHSFATKCVEKGFDTKSLSLILGHSDVSVTLNTYVHPSMERLRSMMSLLD